MPHLRKKMVSRFINENGRIFSSPHRQDEVMRAIFNEDNIVHQQIHGIFNEIDTLDELTKKGCKSTPKLLALEKISNDVRRTCCIVMGKAPGISLVDPKTG